MALPPLGIGVHVSQLYWKDFELFIDILPWDQGLMILLFQERSSVRNKTNSQSRSKLVKVIQPYHFNWLGKIVYLLLHVK